MDETRNPEATKPTEPCFVSFGSPRFGEVSIIRGSGPSEPVLTASHYVVRPANWREVLAGLGYAPRGRRSVCPLCAPEKKGLAASILERGVVCHRDRSHSRSWAALVAASAIPARPGAPATPRHRLTRAEPERVARMLAREAAAYEWAFAKPALDDHPYLKCKRIPPMGSRVDARGNLLVPIYGLGRMGIELLLSLERIAPGGEKRFEAGCRVKGGYCFLRPDWESVDRPRQLGPVPTPHPRRVWTAEGFATAATVALATGEPTCCVFSAGNLVPALETLSRRIPSEFIIAADNDRETPGNPGSTKAHEAARRFGLKVALPEFPAGVEGSDWNDLAAVLDADCKEA